MIKNYFKIAWRNLWKNRVFSLINVIGLSLGMASIATLVVLINQYSTTDDFFGNKDRMYYLKTYAPDGESYQQTVFPLLYEIEKSCPEVAAVTHWQAWDAPWLKSGGKEIQEKTVYVDSGFLKVLSFPMKEGNPETALNEEYSVVISEKVQHQLFGQEPAVGKTIAVNDSLRVRVTGVVEIPVNSSLKADVFFPVAFLKGHNKGFETTANWYNTFAQTYLLLHKNADTTQLNAKINGLVQQFYAEQNKENQVKAVPFDGLKKEAGDVVQKIIVGAGVSAAFILLIVTINLVNLNMATALSRSKEVAVRRMVGSAKSNIVMQFCLENALLVLFSSSIAFVAFKTVLLPWVSDIVAGQLGELRFQWEHGVNTIVLMSLLAVLLILLAAILPAIYLTSIKVTEAVKGGRIKRKGNYGLRNVFIAIQFALGIIFLCIAIILNSQIRYMKSAAPGFNQDDVAVVGLDLAFKNADQAKSRFNVILEGLGKNPYVKSISTSQVVPTEYWDNYNSFTDISNNKEVHLRHVTVDAGFADTYQIPIVAGRNFNDELEATESDKVIINEAAVKAFGWSNPIGKTIRSGGGSENLTVIGVMKDFHYNGLKDPIEPLLHWYGGKLKLGYNSYLSIRMDMNREKAVLSQLKESFDEIPSRKTFSYQNMDNMVAKQYSLIEGILKVTNYVALLTIFIASMGILGLAVLVARQRTKEIGIRKVLGASVTGIVALLSKDFVKLVLISIVIATPIAWYAMNRWLQDFAYRIELQWWMFALAGLLAVVIALLTVSFQSVKAALMNPVDALRSE